MEGYKKALFIINPYSGTKQYPGLEKNIEESCHRASIEFATVTTERPGHAIEIASKATEQNYDLVFAVGGDGTVNEVAQGLIHSSATMGIIPKGSGNGLARHLGIPQKPERALDLWQTGRKIKMDTLSINGEVSVNIAGVGFDGHVSNLFGRGGNRGLLEYATLVASEFRKFKTFPFEAIIDGQPYHSEAFILAFANSSQFGNNATIAPAASVCDGLMDICVIKKVPLLHALGFATKMFSHKMHQSAFVKIIQAKKASISFKGKIPFHLDGEGRGIGHQFSVEIIPASLNILVSSGKV